MLELQILSPTGEIFNDSVDEVILPTDKGEIAILPHHADIFSKLTEGMITVKKSAKVTHIAIIGGFLEIKKGKVVVLSDYAIEAQSIQVARAQEAKKRAEQLLAEKHSNADLLIAEKELQKSIMELRVAEKVKHHS